MTERMTGLHKGKKIF